MEETANSTFFTFDSPKEQSSIIKVIGVGGGGGNAVNHMFREGINGVDFIVCNTDMKALNASPVPNKISLGDLGAGNEPEVARQAALDKADDIREALSHNTKMLFITAGMGGGTGTGAAPVIAEIAKSIEVDDKNIKKILVVAIVTLPFSFEGKRRRTQAQEGIKELSQHVDSIIVINNDKLRAFGNMTLSKAFGMADDVLLTAAKGIAEIITNNAYINIDLKDVNTVMQHSGTALMGAGSGSGENRAIEAITAATTSVLLDDNDINGAKNVLLYFSYSSEHELTMDEQAEITDFILEKTNGGADFIWGAGTDDSLGEELKVILIATGFEKSKVSPEEPKTFLLPDDTPVQETMPVVENHVESDGMELIHKDAPAAEIPVMTMSAPAASAEKHVFVLEDDEPSLENARQTAQAQVEAQEMLPEDEVDVMVEDIHILEPQEVHIAQPAAEVEVKPAEPVYKSAFRNDNDVTAVAERIKHIHELLRNSTNGADIVQGMTTRQISDELLYEGRGSAERESSSTTLRADGRMVQNPYFRDQAD